jgi:hypothetical protein
MSWMSSQSWKQKCLGRKNNKYIAHLSWFVAFAKSSFVRRGGYRLVRRIEKIIPPHFRRLKSDGC